MIAAVIQLCNTKRCGRRAVAWVRIVRPMYRAPGAGTYVRAACAACVGDNEVIERIEQWERII